MKRSLFLLAATTAQLGSQPATACTCVPWPPGATHAAPFLSVVDQASVVVVVTVTAHVGKRHTAAAIPEAMEVSVQEVLRGSVATQHLRIRGDTGALCRPYVTTFPVGTSWVMALRPAEEQRGAYALSSCGEYWLPIQGTDVRGYVLHDAKQTAPEVTVSLTELRMRLAR